MKSKLSISELRKRLNGPCITRFAPAPTGHLHLGHILSLLYVHAAASACTAQLLLRIEDHDQSRLRPEYEESILRDIDWLGIAFSNRIAYSKQSTRFQRYEKAIDQLRLSEQLYYCDCTRKQLTQQGADKSGELCYPGNCRERKLPAGADRGLRLRLRKLPLSFDDLLQGPQRQCAAEQCGDLLLQDRHGNYTYNFAVAVDDLDEGVNLIVRGADLLHCTARQMQLHQALGSDRHIIYAHHPLLTDDSGKKLSKRFYSEAVASRRERGESAESIIGDALYQAGLIQRKGPISLYEAVELLLTI